MSRFSLFIKTLAAGAAVMLMAGALPATALAKTYNVDCTKNGKLQDTIDSAAAGDTIEITGICSENILIRDKGLTLVGAASPGPHGITGVAENTDGVRIENSRGTVMQGLTVSNPHFTCVRLRFESAVDMTDVAVSDCFAGGATGIWVQDGSRFFGTRLRLDDNVRGLGAVDQSRAFCYECDLNDNVNWAASAIRNSQLSLLDSAVSGSRGIEAQFFSYIDVDCNSHESAHACSLNATQLAGRAFGSSTVAFYDAGDFWGRFQAFDRSETQLLGARQQSNPGSNIIDSGSSLRVEPFSGPSRLMGHTDVTGFSHALFYGSDTELVGSLNCDAGGDAWIEPGIVLTNFTRNGCAHAP